MIWTDEQIARLTTLWTIRSASEIAVALSVDGCDVSRNAVIGKAHRIGLSQKAVRPSQRHRPREIVRAQPRKRQVNVVMIRSVGAPPPPVPFIPRIVVTEPLHLTLMQLTDDVCKYECSGASDISDFTFCGNPVVSGTPYCAKHAAICFWKRGTRNHRPSWRGAA